MDKSPLIDMSLNLRFIYVQNVFMRVGGQLLDKEMRKLCSNKS